ncbi:MAG TPA: hypothetical protein VM261_20960 [Kofleriaceae bacterium]|nr:hypothetical protein [Kofleriaceae bacterium]
MKLATLVASAFALTLAARDATAQSYASCHAFDRSVAENARQGMCMAASGTRPTTTVAAQASCIGAISCEHGNATNLSHCRVARAACVGYAQASFLEFGKKPTVDSIWSACEGAAMKLEEPVEGSGRVRALTCFHRARATLGLDDSVEPKPWSCKTESWSQGLCRMIERYAPRDHRHVVTDPAMVPDALRLPALVLEVPVTLTSVPLDATSTHVTCRIDDRGSATRDRAKLDQVEAALAAIETALSGLLARRDLTDAQRVVERERLTREKGELTAERDTRAGRLARGTYDTFKIADGRSERLVTPGGTFTGVIPVLVEMSSTARGDRYYCQASMDRSDGRTVTGYAIGSANGDMPEPTVRPVDVKVPKPATPPANVVPGS